MHEFSCVRIPYSHSAHTRLSVKRAICSPSHPTTSGVLLFAPWQHEQEYRRACMGTNSMPWACATPTRLRGMPAPQLYHHGSSDSSRRSCGLLDCPPNPRFGPARWHAHELARPMLLWPPLFACSQTGGSQLQQNGMQVSISTGRSTSSSDCGGTRRKHAALTCEQKHLAPSRRCRSLTVNRWSASKTHENRRGSSMQFDSSLSRSDAGAAG